MDNSNTTKKSSLEGFSITSITVMTTCFIAGMYIGRKLNNTVRRISSLISVGPSKMALVVRTDLKMTKGKIASQCCHGTLVAYRRMEGSHPKLLQAWLDAGQPKVVLKAADINELQELAKVAREFGVQEVLVCDAGKTQIPQGSETVLVVGPGPVSDIDKITGTLKLL